MSLHTAPRTDVIVDCLPTCQGPDDRPKHAPIAYGDSLVWFMKRNYHGATAEDPRP